METQGLFFCVLAHFFMWCLSSHFSSFTYSYCLPCIWWFSRKILCFPYGIFTLYHSIHSLFVCVYLLTLSFKSAYKVLLFQVTFSNFFFHLKEIFFEFIILRYLQVFFLVIVFQSLSCVWLFVTPWTAACQASLSHCLPEFAHSCPLSQWYHPAISSFVTPLCFYLQFSPASGSFPKSRLFCIQCQSIEASASVLPMNIQCWFPLGLTGLISCCPRDSQESSPIS